MIFAAGLGTRLLPLTEKVPKALIEIHGKPLLQSAIEKVAASGFRDIIINIHHFPDKIREFLSRQSFPGTRIEISDESDRILETGGGLKKASWFFDDRQPFLLYNVDIMTNFDLREMYNDHLRKKPLVTLAVSDRKTSRYLLFNESRMMRGWMNRKTGEVKPDGLNVEELIKLAFSGIHIVSPELLNQMEQEGKYSLTEVYIRLCADQTIHGWEHPAGAWLDAGKPEVLKSIQDKPIERLFNHG